MDALRVRTQPVQGRLNTGPVLCLDIDGAAAPTGRNTRFDVFNPLPAGREEPVLVNENGEAT